MVVVAVLLVCFAGGAALFGLDGQAAGQAPTSLSPTETALARSEQPMPSRAQATPTGIPASYTQFTDAAAGYSVAYPNTWTRSASGGGVTIVDLDSGDNLIILALDGAASPSDINAQLTSFLAGSANGGALSDIQGPTTLALAGEVWTQESATISSQGQVVLQVALATNHGAKEYVIGYTAPKASFTSVNNAYYQPILQTFTFLS